MTNDVDPPDTIALVALAGVAGGFPGCREFDFQCQAVKVAQWRDRTLRRLVSQQHGG
jgi:hypothetical protein